MRNCCVVVVVRLGGRECIVQDGVDPRAKNIDTHFCASISLAVTCKHFHCVKIEL